MSDSPEALRLAFRREFSTGGRQLATAPFNTLRDLVRIEIYKGGMKRHRFQDTALVYEEAFLEAFGERLDRRAVLPPLPDESNEEEDEDA